MQALKSAYTILAHSGQMFLAMQVSAKIAEWYRDNQRPITAKKYFLQCEKLAHGLGNERKAKDYSEQADKVADTVSTHTRLIQAFHEISGVLNNLADYRPALNRVLQFAVDETGAERGVLLLRADDKSELRIKAYVHCDRQSLDDIQDFSKSIPQSVAGNFDPLFIENARQDKRTRNYKSIAVHNILSVICLPIRVNDQFAGVIYLDHHTIPALFEDVDRISASSVANLVSTIIARAQQLRNIRAEAGRLRDQLRQAGTPETLITRNPVMLDMLSKLEQIAKTNASILLMGESGTGKEILGEMIHKMSLRSRGPLVKLNCAAIPSTLIESELFGVAKNAATGVDEREGKFSTADGGTLFLDEIGDMPLEVQAKVLRVLEHQCFEKVGSPQSITTDVRFVYATNKDLRRLVEDGRFRRDLFYRINTFAIEIPPLRKRADDIMLLVEHFMKLQVPDEHQHPRLAAGVREILVSYHWPGNVRELRNVVERLCIMAAGSEAHLTDLPEEISLWHAKSKRGGKSDEGTEKALIETMLRDNDWNRTKVARLMNLP
ncbi:MAG: sigma-54-dependent Fis family transcriptional regulator, partial [Candidatus Zixiibacteriota bacterium]